MKMSPDSLDLLRRAIEPQDTAERRSQYKARQIPRAEHVIDIDKRYRWDLLYIAANQADIFVTNFYDDGLNDTHIDTALRSIVPRLETP